MKAEVYWVPAPGPGKIAIMPRPRGGDWLGGEMRSLKDQGLTILVSLLEAGELRELDLSSEPAASRKADLEYLAFPIPDRGVPGSVGRARGFFESLSRRMDQGAAIAVHCRAGIGRSALVAAAVLILRGVPLQEALDRLSEARGFTVPETTEQRDWLDRFSRISRS